MGRAQMPSHGRVSLWSASGRWCAFAASSSVSQHTVSVCHLSSVPSFTHFFFPKSASAAAAASALASFSALVGAGPRAAGFNASAGAAGGAGAGFGAGAGLGAGAGAGAATA